MTKYLHFLARCFVAFLAPLNLFASAGAHWSFQQLASPSVPVVRNQEWPLTPLDAFVLQKLEEKQIAPSSLASPEKLVRRIYFDLAGLPPSPAEIDRFVSACRQDRRAAIAGLVDSLLASPHYGERWARHWLDVARYADSNGSESDHDRPTAYRYRDFLIRAFNRDMPFNEMLAWQLAGDEFEPENPEAIAATGFIVAGTHIILDVPMEEEKIRTRYNELDDMISTTGSAMLALTLACARCHDHKYDPIPTRDYYRMLSAFNAGGHTEVPLLPPKEARAFRAEEAQWKKDSAEAKKRLDEFAKKVRDEFAEQVRQTKINSLLISAEDRKVLLAEPKSENARALSKRFAKELKVQDTDLRNLLSEEKRDEWKKLEASLKNMRKPSTPPTALAFADYQSEPRDNWLLARGDFHTKKEPVELGFLTVLTSGKKPADYLAEAKNSRRRDDSTQQRRALANWLIDRDEGAGNLAARVIVNRVWQHHFGEGLVRTVNDFGVRGQAPTHPELLEWLTTQFVNSGWSLKMLHRLIMTSSVYLQDSRFQEASAKVDPDNLWLWRHAPQRVESEILRDSMLAVSGTLNLEMFGPAFKPPIASEAIQARNVKDPYPENARDHSDTRRRSVYMFHKRVVQYPLMQAFDAPEAQASCGRREHTTVAPQALALLNDRFVRARAEDFAHRLLRDAGPDPRAQVRLAWRLALGREPSPAELTFSLEYLGSQSGETALANFCQAIFAFNEFVYVD